MKYLAIILAFFCNSLFYSFSQNKKNITIESGCFYNYDESDNSIIVYDPTNIQYVKIIHEIILSKGIKKDIQVYESDIDNAMATILDGKMVIIYDPKFLELADKLSNNKGGSTLILAHEIGHLLNIHSLDPSESSSWWDELEADFFAGLIAYNKKIPLESIFGLYELFPTMSERNSTHPEWQARIKTTINGYCNGVMTTVLNNPIKLSEPKSRITQLQTQLSALLNKSIINLEFDNTIKYSVENSKITRYFKDDSGTQSKEEINISEISSIELRPHDVGVVSFQTFTGESYWWSLGSEHSKEIIYTYNSKGYIVMDDEVSSREDFELLKKICQIIGEIKVLVN